MSTTRHSLGVIATAVLTAASLAACSGGSDSSPQSVSTSTSAAKASASAPVHKKYVAVGLTRPVQSVPSAVIGVETLDSVPTWKAGDCLDWGGSVTTETTIEHVVSCTEPHDVELAGSITLTRPGYPTDAEWDVIARRECRSKTESLLGAPYDPSGRYFVTTLHGLPFDWVHSKYRVVQCAVGEWGVSAPPGSLAINAFVGTVRGTQQARSVPSGTCEDLETVYTTPCRTPHTWEVSGYLDLTFSVARHPVTALDWQRAVRGPCDKFLPGFLGRPLHPNEVADWYRISADSWAAGNRVVECVVGHVDGSGKAVPISGPIKKA